jgi:cobalt-zinc-cadmium efflux system outer membrane protein
MKVMRLHVGIFWGTLVFAGTAAAETSPCASITRENLATCVTGTSPAVRAGREAAAAASGRRIATEPWLPSNPTLALSLARRSGTEGRPGAVNYTATLSQEIQLNGQRAARRRAAEADVGARELETLATTRRVVADGYTAYFEVLASRDAAEVARRLEATALQIARVTKGRSEAGVSSPMDSEVAEAASLRVAQVRLAAERELGTSSAHLNSLLGRDATKPVEVSGTLEPLAGVDGLAPTAARLNVERRPEVRALASDQRAWSARAEAFRRARIPNVTLQLFAQNDGYDERVLGAGLALPLPLPQPVGNRYTGEIREAEATARETAARTELLVRELGADLAVAVTDYESRRAEAALFTRDRADRADRYLADLAKELEAGRVSVRDALLAQQQLIDVLRGFVETRRALCLASVDLALAAGLPLEGAGR